jgi:TolB-like protein/DNA-binding winged helix-turn-helix (wHTH) protein/Flp pilus assembly protein TadD
MTTSLKSRRVRFGAFEADLSSSELLKHGIRIKIQDQPFQILALLVERPGMLVPREELRKKLWAEDTFVDFDAGLNAAIRRLRDALNDSADEPRYIETLPRHGYRFIASVETVPDPTPTPCEEASHEAGSANPVQQSTLPPSVFSGINPAPMASNRMPWVLGLGTASVLAVVTVLLAPAWRAQLFSTHAATGIHSIAVLPLQNLSGDPNQEYFADGMTDALITNLAEIGSLRVISRTSAMQYKGSRKTLPEIAKELNVDAIVEGSVVRSEDRVRIDAQLIRADNDFRLWGKSYERKINDILILQSDVVHSIAKEIEITLSAGQTSTHTTAQSVNPEAYEAYLKGAYFYQGSEEGVGSEEGLEKAIKYYRKSIDLDPNYVPANLGLGQAYAMMAFVGGGDMPPAEAWAKSETFLAKSLELDPNSSLAHALIGMNRLIRHCDRAEAERELDLALKLDPNDIGALDYHSYFLLRVGRGEEALAEKKRVLEHDPVSVITNSEYGLYLRELGRIDEAIQQFQNTLELDPNSAVALQRLSRCYAAKHEYEQAVPLLEKALAIEDVDGRRGLLGSFYAHAGKPSKARAVIAELKELSKQRHVCPSLIASIYALLGEKDQAIAWLGKAQKDDSPSPSDADFDSLRSDPRFVAIEARLKPDSECAY